MALPIKETPILKGERARRFEKELKKNEKRPVPRAEYDRAQAVYSELKKKSSFWR